MISALPRLAPLALALIAAAVPARASAGWSPALRVPLSTGGMWPAAAVNGDGDLAVAWIQEGRSGGHATLRVRAAIRPAGTPRFVTRTLVSARDRAARGATVALDARGELTVAWIEQASDNGRTHGHKTVRAAFRVPSGRWSAVRDIGRSPAFNYATPRVAATPEGTVVLTYNAHVRHQRAVVAAWRRRGHGFGALQTVPTAHQYLFDPVLAVDTRGGAFLTGTSGCDQPGGDVAVATAAPGSRRFTTRTVLSATPGSSTRMALMAPGSVAVTWFASKCNTTEDLGGVPYAASLIDGKATAPVALGDTGAATLIAGSAPGGADVSFAVWPSTTPGGTLMSAHVANDGTVGTAAPAADGWVAVAGDTAGDQLLAHPDPVANATTALAARRATGGPTEPAPLPAVGFPWTGGALAAHDGQALAALSFRPLSSMQPWIAMAVWRP
jgi:hypothetical protein